MSHSLRVRHAHDVYAQMMTNYPTIVHEGGGSLTALPIIETQGNDVSACIPTNVRPGLYSYLDYLLNTSLSLGYLHH